MYREIKPSKGIDHLIESFWTYSTYKINETFKVMPDACADLIFDINKNKRFLSGVMTNYQLADLPPESKLLGVRFKIEKFGCLTKTPVDKTKNLQVELSEIFSSNKLSTLNHMTDVENVEDKIDLLENFVAQSFIENSTNRDQVVLMVAQKIRSTQGVTSVTDIAKAHHISLRQLERRFKSFMGLTIKQFSNIVRFNQAKTSIRTLTKTSLMEIAFDLGFYDHSHMTHEFKRLSGENPSFFR